MIPNNPWKSYRQVATQTASPGQLVLMLFDGAIRFLNRALSGFESDDPQEFNETINNNISRAQEIVNELNLSLDMNAGGELAMHLRRLYYYIDSRLVESNLKKETAGINEALLRLGELREAWSQMLQSQSQAVSTTPLAISAIAA
jgi:flagellar secretion chaperone FliS